MPKQVEQCVSSLMSKWKDDPSSRPKPKEEGQDAKSQAWAICNAAHKRAQDESLGIMLEGGYGPVLIGAAATNRPYIPRLEETQVKEIDGEKKLVVHLANPGFFNHPTGAFTLNHAVFSTLIQNFNDRVVGQREAYDCRHQPNLGAFGWFEKLWIQDKKLYGQVDPTPVGLEQIDNKMYLYSSMEFHRNYQRDDVKLDLEDATEDFCVLDLEEDYESDLWDLGYALEDSEKMSSAVVSLMKKFIASEYKVLELGEFSGEAPLGTVVRNGKLYIGKDAAKAYLSAIKNPEAKLDMDSTLLFNPYHSKKDGKFTTKSGGPSFSEAHVTKPSKAAYTVGAVAGFIGGAAIGGVAGRLVGGLVGFGAGAAKGRGTPNPEYHQSKGIYGGATIGNEIGGLLGAFAGTNYFIKEYKERKQAWEEATNRDLDSANLEDSMTDEERIQLEQELEEERDRVTELEKERDEAMERATKLEQEAVDNSVASVVELAQNHRDKSGKALPKPFVEWVSKVLKFEDFGKDKDVVKLSEEAKPGVDMIKYLAGAVRSLIMDMPGTVPTNRLSIDSDQESDQEFDFNELWDQAGEGD